MKTEQTTEKQVPPPGIDIPAASVWQDAKQQDIAASTPAPQPEASDSNIKQPKGYIANHMGKWAHEHKDYMSNNWLPWYGVRNVGASALGIGTLVTILVPVRKGFGALRKATEGSTGKLGKAINTTANGLVENIIGTGLSFAGFRTGYKLWQREYDKLFVKPQTEEDASKAVDNLGSNIAKDIAYLAPVEFPATLISAVPLVAMRSGIRLHGNDLNPAKIPGKSLFEIAGPKGKMIEVDAGGLVAAGKDSRIKDVLGCIPAYTAFFEMNERIFDDFQTRRGHRKNEHSHVKGVLPPDEQHKEKKPFDTMLEDTPARMYFYKVASVAAGIVPYITWSRYAQNTKGWQMNAANDSFWSAWIKENKMFQGFALYTVGSEAVRNNIDRLFQKLQDKELEKQGIQK